jgi:hypothetical protein
MLYVDIVGFSFEILARVHCSLLCAAGRLNATGAVTTSGTSGRTVTTAAAPGQPDS